MNKWLVQAFGEPAPDALENSLTAARVQDNPRYRGWSNLDHVLIAYSPTRNTLNVVVEPLRRGNVNMRQACQTTWQALLGNCDGLKPSLRTLSLSDGADGPEVASASTARAEHLRGSEIIPALSIAIATVAVIVIAVVAGASSQLMLGMIAPVVGAAVVVCLALLRAKQKKLVWK